MVWLNKHASQLIDRNLQRKDKAQQTKIENFNEEAALLHKKLRPLIDEQALQHVSAYVNQYISHTDIWTMKFKTNMQNAEVATMQMLHLTFVIATVHGHEREWAKFRELQAQFPALSDFAETQFSMHYERIKQLLTGEEQ